MYRLSPCSSAFGSSERRAQEWDLGTKHDFTFNATGRFGNEGVSQARTADFTTAETEVGGVLLCISCHDGNLTPQNMLANDPYEHRLASGAKGLKANEP
jgi:hypothetical protein